MAFRHLPGLFLLAALTCFPLGAQVLPVGALAHLVSGGGWTTTITLHNNGPSSVQTRLSFYGDSGSLLSLPFTFPQTSTGSALTTSRLDNTIGPGEEWVIRTTGPADKDPISGWTQLSADGSVTGFAVFSYASGASLNEAVVPLETRNPAQFFLSFENTEKYVTGVAVANVSTEPATISLTIRDDKAARLYSGNIQLAGHAHTAIVVPTTYTATSNKRGTLQFDTPAGGQISVLGLSFNPTIAFSTIPASTIGTAPGLSDGIPRISGVSTLQALQAQTITITGSGFGTQPAYSGGTSFIKITDETGGWNAGFLNSVDANTVGLDVTSWDDTKIVLAGFVGDYGKYGYVLQNGDKVRVQVWNAQSQTGPAAYSLTVGSSTQPAALTIVTSSLPNGTVGTAYNQNLTAAGGSGGTIWSLVSGALPGGLSLGGNGAITGAPSAAGSFSFAAQASDTTGKTALRTLGITIAASSGGSGGSGPIVIVGPRTQLSRAKIEPGMATTLTWGSPYPTVTISPGIGRVASTGTLDLRPTATTQYVILFQGPNGETYQETQTVTVVPVASILSFKATPSAITVGDSATLEWSTANAHYIQVDPMPYAIYPGTSLTGTTLKVSPTQTTTYTLTVVDLLDDYYTLNPQPPIGAKVTKQVTVTVGSVPSGSGTGSNGGGGGGSGGGGYTGKGTVVTPIWGSCITSFYDPAVYNWLATRNSCSIALDVTGLWNDIYGPGAATVKAGGVTNWARSQTEVNSHGGITFFACPVNYLPVDSTGTYVKNPKAAFWCRAP